MRSETSYRMLAFEKFTAEKNWSENNRLFNYSIAILGTFFCLLTMIA